MIVLFVSVKKSRGEGGVGQVLLKMMEISFFRQRKIALLSAA